LHERHVLNPQTILVFLSVTFDAIALILVSLAQSPQAAIVAFGVFALGSGDAPTYKSVFVAAVPERHASECRRASASAVASQLRDERRRADDSRPGASGA
jgi:hypothetical protein